MFPRHSETRETQRRKRAQVVTAAAELGFHAPKSMSDSLGFISDPRLDEPFGTQTWPHAGRLASSD